MLYAIDWKRNLKYAEGRGKQIFLNAQVNIRSFHKGKQNIKWIIRATSLRLKLHLWRNSNAFYIKFSLFSHKHLYLWVSRIFTHLTASLHLKRQQYFTGRNGKREGKVPKVGACVCGRSSVVLMKGVTFTPGSVQLFISRRIHPDGMLNNESVIAAAALCARHHHSLLPSPAQTAPQTHLWTQRRLIRSTIPVGLIHKNALVTCIYTYLCM